jgi:hypothetical protein
VTLVLDTSCGESLAGLDHPLWVCDSPVNRPVAERLWSKPNLAPTAVTLFRKISESEDEVFADIIPTIDEHHPDWTDIAVVGAFATPAVRARFARFAPGQFLESAAGFMFVRSECPDDVQSP